MKKDEIERVRSSARRILTDLRGDADWASNAGIANAANRLLLSSAANWALERESLVAIPPKSADQVAVTLTRRDIGQVAFVVMLFLPLAAVAMGIAIWARRRK